MRWRLWIHHEHGNAEIPNVIEGDTVNIHPGLAVHAVTIEPQPDQTVILPTEVPGGPAEPTFELPPESFPEDSPEVEPTPEPESPAAAPEGTDTAPVA